MKSKRRSQSEAGEQHALLGQITSHRTFFSYVCLSPCLAVIIARPDRIRMLQVQGPSFNPINVWSLIHNNYDVRFESFWTLIPFLDSFRILN